LKTAAIILYVIQAVAIICAIITGQEFIDFSSGPALFETIGFFSPAILGAILEMIANNKEQKTKSTAEGSSADNVAPSASSAPKSKAAAPASAPQRAPKKGQETTAAAAKCQPVIDPSVQHCPKCGTKQNAENVFCIACGSKIGQ
jgi:hypothetical protein